MPMWLRAAFNLSEAEIRWAMQNSISAIGAAAFLKIKRDTFKRYAVMYYDKESGLNLYELHLKNCKERRRQQRRRVDSSLSSTIKMESILAGEHPVYNLTKLQTRLIAEGILLEQCNLCGYHERRVTDYTVPLHLAFLDGDSTNHKIENMELVCFNCFYLYYGDVFKRKYRVDVTLYKRDRNIIK